MDSLPEPPQKPLISFLLKAESYYIVCIHHSLLIRSSVDGHRLLPPLGYWELMDHMLFFKELQYCFL